MPWLTNLADIARRSGYTVVEVPGWKTRGHGPQPRVLGIVAHHTAGWNDLHVVRDGRPGLDGPLSQFWLSKNGTIFVVAAGRCWHNAPSTSEYHTNTNSIGIEAENDGKTPWPARQLDSYKRLCAALCEAFELPASRVKGHKEVQRGKPDPHSINMDDFRADIAKLMRGEEIDMDADEIYKAVWKRDIMPAPWDNPKNPTWTPENVLRTAPASVKAARESLEKRLDNLALQLEKTQSMVRELLNKVNTSETGE